MGSIILYLVCFAVGFIIGRYPEQVEKFLKQLSKGAKGFGSKK